MQGIEKYSAERLIDRFFTIRYNRISEDSQSDMEHARRQLQYLILEEDAMAEKKAAPVTTVKSEVDTMIDALVEKAQVALQEFLKLDQEQVDHIVHEMKWDRSHVVL